MIANIASHVADNQLERDVNDVERFIVNGGENGRTREAVQKSFRRLGKRGLTDILEALEDQGSISRTTIQNPMGGRPRTIFRAI